MIDRNLSEWFRAKGTERPPNTVVTSGILPMDAHAAEIGEVIVASALLGATSLDDVGERSNMTPGHQAGEDPWMGYDPEDYAEVGLIDHCGDNESCTEHNLTDHLLHSPRVDGNI